jgi:hypothetical protein
LHSLKLQLLHQAQLAALRKSTARLSDPSLFDPATKLTHTHTQSLPLSMHQSTQSAQFPIQAPRTLSACPAVISKECLDVALYLIGKSLNKPEWVFTPSTKVAHPSPLATWQQSTRIDKANS